MFSVKETRNSKKDPGYIAYCIKTYESLLWAVHLLHFPTLLMVFPCYPIAASLHSPPFYSELPDLVAKVTLDTDDP